MSRLQAATFFFMPLNSWVGERDHRYSFGGILLSYQDILKIDTHIHYLEKIVFD